MTRPAGRLTPAARVRVQQSTRIVPSRKAASISSRSCMASPAWCRPTPTGTTSSKRSHRPEPPASIRSSSSRARLSVSSGRTRLREWPTIPAGATP
eukprot:scaffold11090_cov40-Phaeocystis_antarctica.AAC.3